MDLTIIIRTFERPDAARQLIRSIRDQHPKIPILIGDDSRERYDYPGATVVRFPHDIGAAAGRNRLIERVQTDRVLVLDDDYVFFHRTKLRRAYAAAVDSDADIYAGSWWRWKGRPPAHYRRLFYRHDGVLHRKLKVSTESVTRVDFTLQLHISKTDVIRGLAWDEQFLFHEHTDFFLRAKMKDLTVLYDQQFLVLHDRRDYQGDPGRRKIRKRMVQDHKRFEAKWGLWGSDAAPPPDAVPLDVHNPEHHAYRGPEWLAAEIGAS